MTAATYDCCHNIAAVITVNETAITVTMAVIIIVSKAAITAVIIIAAIIIVIAIAAMTAVIAASPAIITLHLL